MYEVPEVITHNYDPARGAFRNICALARQDAERILEEIRASGKRKIKPDYLQRRHSVEDWLIGKRQEKLGETPLQRPLYFFLGDFADGRDPTRPSALVMPLTSLSPEVVTFTYPDSMASLPIALREEHEVHRKPYHGKLYTLSEIREVIAEFGLPGTRWQSDPSMRYDRFIEVQVWDDKAIKASFPDIFQTRK